MTDTTTTTDEPINVEVEALRLAVAERDAKIAAFEQQIENITVRLHRLGEDQGWCNEFDRELENHGLAPRRHRYQANVTWRVETTHDLGTMTPSERSNTYVPNLPLMDDVQQQIRDALDGYDNVHIELWNVDVDREGGND